MDDLRQSPNYAQYMEEIGWKVERVEGYQIFIKKLPLIGSIIKIQRPKKIPFEEIDKIARKYRAIFVKIEPGQVDDGSWMMDRGYKPDSSPMLPTKTLQINLTQSLEEIFSQMKKDARSEIRKAQKNKIAIKKSEDIETFMKMWHQNALRRGFWIPFKKEIKSIYEAFDRNAYLLLTSPSSSKQLLAGALILIHDKVAYYFQAASTPLGRKLSAPYLIVWEGIKLAKENSCQVFDFEGIYDERFPIKSWKGFTHFKKSFGGKEIEYSGCFIKFYNPVLDFMATLRRLI